MRGVKEMTDDILKKMEPKKIWPWDDWWTEFVQDGQPPSPKNPKHGIFVGRRLQIKNQVNRELTHRQMAVRLILKHGKGLYLEDKNHVAQTFVEDRSKKVANAFTAAIINLVELSRAKELPVDDQKLLSRVIGGFELNQSALAGTFARMRSLTAVAKKQILLNFGVKL